MEAQTPFIKLLYTPIGEYFFDVNKNQIISINEKVYNYLNSLIKGNETHADNKTLAEFNFLKEQGFLSGKRPSLIRHSYTDYLQLFLERKLNKITLQVTQQCNFRCKYCIYSENKNLKQRSHSTKKMTWENAKKAIDFLWNHSVDSKMVSISFYGGEPLLEFELIKKSVEYSEAIFKGKSLLFTTTVNGSLLTDQNVEYFIKHNIGLMISLDGPKEIHDMNRVFIDGRGTYDTVIKNIKHINEKFPEYAKKIRINMVIDPTNDFDCVNSITINNDCINFDNFNFSFVENIDEPVISSIQFIQHSEYQKFLALLSHFNYLSTDQISPVSKKNIVNILSDIDKMVERDFIPDTMAPGGPCIPGQIRLFSNVNGDLFPCERVNETAVMKIGTLDSGFNYERVKEILNIGSLTPEECKNCWAINNCITCAKMADDGEKLSPELKIRNCSLSKNTAINKFRTMILLREIPVYYKEIINSKIERI